MSAYQSSNGLSREQKMGFIFMLIFAILTVSLGALQLRNTVYGPFVIRAAKKVGIETLLTDKETRLTTIDTDQDGLTDYEELTLYQTSAYLPDTDSDGVKDKVEIDAGADPLCPAGKTCASESERPPSSTTTPFISPLQDSVVTPLDVLSSVSAPSFGAPGLIGAGGTDAGPGILGQPDASRLSATTTLDLSALIADPAQLRALILATGKIDAKELEKIDDATLKKLAENLVKKSAAVVQ